MASSRARSQRSIVNKLADLSTQASSARKNTSDPHMSPGAVTGDHIAEDGVSQSNIAPDSVGSREIKRGAVGTEHLGVVNAINSDGSLVLTVPQGNLYLRGDEYVVAPGDRLSMRVDEDGKVTLGTGAAFLVSDTAPLSPSPGDGWFDSDTGAIYVYYNDGTSSQWVAARLTAADLPDELTFARLRLTSTDDVTTSSTLHALQIGATAATNLRLDGNEIQALSNGAVSNLNLQLEGGNINVGNSSSTHILNGLIREPNVPAFQAKSAANQTFSGTASSVKATLGIADVNNGGHYSTANSRFTAPVAGSYVFSYNSAQSTTVSGPEVELFVNGSQRYGDLAIGYATSFMSFGGSWVVSLAASDYVEIFITNNNGVTLTLSAGRSWFSGFFLG